MSLYESKLTVFEKPAFKSFWESIQNTPFSGWVWNSDSAEGFVVDGALPTWESFNDDQRFLHEAQLFSSDSKKSLSVRQINHTWQVTEVEWKTNPHHINDVAVEKQSFMLAGLEGETYANFITLYREENDEFCENMTTLKAGIRAFIGFKKEI